MIPGLENPFHLLLIAVVVLLLFGAKRLPEMGRSLGSGMREFKNGITGKELEEGTRGVAPGAPAGQAPDRETVA